MTTFLLLQRSTNTPGGRGNKSVNMSGGSVSATTEATKIRNITRAALHLHL